MAGFEEVGFVALARGIDLVESAFQKREAI
jgi:hypothetical protein